jgi:CheY-like chemotaxis protein
MKKILFLDDSEERHKIFKEKFNIPDTKVIHVRTVQEAIDELDKGDVEVAFLDHDLGGEMFVKRVEGTGYEVVLHIEKMPKEKRPYQVIIHSHNPAGVIRMRNALQRSVEKVQIAPFGSLFPEYNNK